MLRKSQLKLVVWKLSKLVGIDNVLTSDTFNLDKANYAMDGFAYKVRFFHIIFARHTNCTDRFIAVILLEVNVILYRTNLAGSLLRK